jgi:glycerol dehydrogenase-like iron-containing ADH family enzyme
MKFAHNFQTVFGRNLVGELKNFVHRPFLLVTMEDMWPKFEPLLEGADYIRYFVHSVDEEVLNADLARLPSFEAVVGLGGGMAVDTAKYITWKKRVPLFQIQTALSMNASWGQRAGIRQKGVVRYIGWAVPEAVYIDYDILRGAPAHFNWSGIGDILCNHTGVLDWRYATERGFCEAKWPYDEEMAQASLEKAENVLKHTQDIHALNQKGFDVLIDGLRWGTSYHGNGWNPRHIEGIDHFFFYSLEYETGQKFIHGQPVSLGVYIGSLLHNSRAGEMIGAMHDIGLDIRPEAMKVTWKDVEKALKGLNAFVRDKKLWYSIAHDTTFTSDFVADLKDKIEAVYGRWKS